MPRTSLWRPLGVLSRGVLLRLVRGTIPVMSIFDMSPEVLCVRVMCVPRSVRMGVVTLDGAVLTPSPDEPFHFQASRMGWAVRHHTSGACITPPPPPALQGKTLCGALPAPTWEGHSCPLHAAETNFRRLLEVAGRAAHLLQVFFLPAQPNSCIYSLSGSLTPAWEGEREG